MKHIHHGTCPECGRDDYVIVRQLDTSAAALPAIALYHLDEPCAITQAVPADTPPESIPMA
jgi:hypothetical protein